MLINVWAYILALLTQKSVSFSANGSSLPTTNESYDLAPRPLLAVTIPTKAPEAKVDKLVQAGFSARTNGRYKYFLGPSSDEGVRAAIQVGVATDAFAPGNTISVNGVVTFSLMSRLLFAAFHVIHNLTTPQSAPTSAAPISSPLDQSFKLTEASLTELPEKGFFFPYFDGLLLPDHGSTPIVFLQRFSNLFGKAAQVAETARTVMLGWSSLNDTVAGKQYSHMMYCLDQAIQAGISLRPVYIRGEYAGCVFNTNDTIVFQGGQGFIPQNSEELSTAIGIMKSHDVTLAEIATILNGAAEESAADDQVVRKLVASEIRNGRDLHNFCRQWSFPSNIQARVNSLLPKLRFGGTYYEPTNAKHVQITTAIILSKEFPDENIPFNLRHGQVWTKNPVVSALCAFGLKAPSLRGKDTKMVRRASPEMYSGVDKPGHLTGIPIFAKAIDRAQEDWEGLLNEYTVWWGHRGADKQKKLKILDVCSYIPMGSEEGKGITNQLKSMVQTGKKRAREDEDPREPTQDEIDRKQKAEARRLKGYGVVGTILGLAEATDTMDVDEDIFT